MPLKNIPATINPDLLYVLAKMGHGINFMTIYNSVLGPH